MSHENPNALTGDTQAAVRSAETAANRQREMLRPYLPGLLNRLALTYGLPALGAVLVAAIVSRVLDSLFPPSLTTSFTVFLVALAIIIFGWRYAERRWEGTSLFVLYTAYSRERRALERLAGSAANGEQVSTAEIDNRLEAARKAAEQFLEGAQKQGIAPVTPKD